MPDLHYGISQGPAGYARRRPTKHDLEETQAGVLRLLERSEKQAKIEGYNTAAIAELHVTQCYLAKAEESLAGAESEFMDGRYNNTADRSYYPCFQAAIAALLREGFDSRR